MSDCVPIETIGHFVSNAERIPRYMIPELFEFRDVLPKTSTGKIDRQALVGATELQGETS